MIICFSPFLVPSPVSSCLWLRRLMDNDIWQNVKDQGWAADWLGNGETILGARLLRYRSFTFSHIWQNDRPIINLNPKQAIEIESSSLAVAQVLEFEKNNGTSKSFQFSIFVSRVQNEKYHFWTLAKSRSKFESNQRQLRGPSTSQQINRNRDENVIDQPHHRLRRDDGWRQQWGKISFPATIDTARRWHIWYSHCVETSPIAPVGWLSILGSLLVGLCS